MPFTSENQRRKCWVLWNQSKRQGKKPKWDCKKWESYSKFSNKSKECGVKCPDGHKCKRLCYTKRCWQHY